MCLARLFWQCLQYDQAMGCTVTCCQAGAVHMSTELGNTTLSKGRRIGERPAGLWCLCPTHQLNTVRYCTPLGDNSATWLSLTFGSPFAASAQRLPKRVITIVFARRAVNLTVVALRWDFVKLVLARLFDVEITAFGSLDVPPPPCGPW